MTQKSDPFKIEKLRTEFAKVKDYSNLAKTYSKSNPEIQDNNTSKLWDYLNLESKSLIKSNPMEQDRLLYVVSLIKESKISLLNIGFGSANLESVYFKSNSSSNIRWSAIDISKKSVEEA